MRPIEYFEPVDSSIVGEVGIGVSAGEVRPCVPRTHDEAMCMFAGVDGSTLGLCASPEVEGTISVAVQLGTISTVLGSLQGNPVGSSIERHLSLFVGV